MTNHLPPHTDIFHRFDPRRVVVGTRVVEVENQIRRKHVAGVIAHHHSAPGSMGRSLHISLIPFGIGGQPRLKHHILVIKIEMHTRIINQGGLMKIDIQPVVGLHLERRLHPGRRKLGLRSII